MAAARDTIGTFASILAAPTIWAAHFFLIYGAQTLICTGPEAPARGGLLLPIDVALTATALSGLLYLMTSRRPSRQAHQATEGAGRSLFWRDTPVALATLAMLGVLWVAVPPILLPACAPAA
jgi:hypothetical protein